LSSHAPFASRAPCEHGKHFNRSGDGTGSKNESYPILLQYEVVASRIYYDLDNSPQELARLSRPFTIQKYQNNHNPWDGLEILGSHRGKTFLEGDFPRADLTLDEILRCAQDDTEKLLRIT
jgi:hypothetical protein